MKSQKEKNSYILGTETAELHRLGLQHQVWASEAIKGWELAGFSQGQTLLDLGCGPGYCTTELAFITGVKGRVLAVDKSAFFIDFLNKLSKTFSLNIETQCSDFDHMLLDPESLHGVYSRWALAWVPNPQEVLTTLFKALKPGGTVVTHEYFDWSTLQTEPFKPVLNKAIKAALQSLRDQNGNIDVGRKLPLYFKETGFEIVGNRAMCKMATPDKLSWHWPKSFFNNYFPKLVDLGYLSNREVSEALAEFDALERTSGATIFCPVVREVIAKKPRII